MAFQFPILENFLNVEVEESQAVEVMKSENANGDFPHWIRKCEGAAASGNVSITKHLWDPQEHRTHTGTQAHTDTHTHWQINTPTQEELA